MIFALGACLAGLLALLCLPAISRRALRMAQVAVERQMPISVDEIVAQRDLLRGEFATERRRLEQALERSKDRRAHEAVEVGRRTAEVIQLAADLRQMTAAHEVTQSACTAAERLANETSAENVALQKALFDDEGLQATLRDRLAVLSRDHAALVENDADKARAIAALESERNALAAAREALDRALMQAKLDLSISRAREEALAAQIDNHEQTSRTAAATEAALRLEIGSFEARSAPVASAGDSAEASDLVLVRRAIVEIGHEVVRLAEREQRLTDADAFASVRHSKLKKHGRRATRGYWLRAPKQKWQGTEVPCHCMLR